MNDRELAVLCTHVVTAMKEESPRRLDPIIDELEVTPWNHEIAEVLKAVRYQIEREVTATKSTAKGKKK
jgi:hypothetical protein